MNTTDPLRRLDASPCRSAASRWRLPLIALLYGLSGGFVGCSDGGGSWEKVTVEGAVTLDGKKVVNGDIRFIPTAASTGPTVGAEIIDGQYRVTNKGGVPVGTHRVVLRAFNVEGVGPATASAGSDDLFGGEQAKKKPAAKPSLPIYMVEGYAQFLPPAYNRDTSLKIEITGSDNPQIEDFKAVSVVP